jgi:NAD(P)-dependent dehydrogenase (short-subunit alcohol dehydrogenase family)
MSILDRFSMNERVVIVTGASSGLGVAFAEAFASAGANLVLAARREDLLRETAVRVEHHGRRALCVVTDVARHEDAHAMVAAAFKEYGRVDALINNAGVGSARPALNETPDDFCKVIEVNLNGSFWASQAAAKVMQPRSSIVNVSSILALTTTRLPQAAYCASKAGLLGLTRDLAQQWGRRKGIRVNALAPGFFRSEMTAAVQEHDVQHLIERSLLNRIGEPEELAAVAVWLASDASSFVTGQTIVVDGGVTIT